MALWLLSNTSVLRLHNFVQGNFVCYCSHCLYGTVLYLHVKTFCAATNYCTEMLNRLSVYVHIVQVAENRWNLIAPSPPRVTDDGGITTEVKVISPVLHCRGVNDIDQ